MAAMSVRTLRWVSVIVPTAFVVAFEIITRTVFADVVPSWVHVVVALAAVSLGAFLFSTFVFATIGRLERQVVERNRRLAILNALAADTSESLDVGGAGSSDHHTERPWRHELRDCRAGAGVRAERQLGVGRARRGRCRIHSSQ